MSALHSGTGCPRSKPDLKREDEILLSGSLKGDPNAQRQLYDRYKVSMFRLCLRYARGRDEAEDFLQEGFIRVFKDLNQFTAKGPLGAWIRKVVLNTVLQEIRRKSKFKEVELDEIMFQLPSEVDIEGALNAKVITEIIQQLPLGYRTVFNLFAIEGYSHKEISEQMGISESTSKTQLLKAKKWLRNKISKESII